MYHKSHFKTFSNLDITKQFAKQIIFFNYFLLCFVVVVVVVVVAFIPVVTLGFSLKQQNNKLKTNG